MRRFVAGAPARLSVPSKRGLGVKMALFLLEGSVRKIPDGYFFVNYEERSMSQADIDLFTVLVKGKDAAQLDPSFAQVNRLSMYDMLRAFDQLSDEERKRFSQAAFDGIPAQGCGVSHTLPEAKQVFIDRIKFAFDVVTKKTVPRPIPGDLYETGQVMDAYEFLGNTPPTVSVWATCIGSVCADARLRQQGDGKVIGADQTYGQAGWDIGIMYGTLQFDTLPQRITSRCQGSLIKRLSLNAHGDPGVFAVNGVDQTMMGVNPMMKASDIAGLDTNFEKVLQFLNRVMIKDGIILLQGCLAGKSDGGTTLLTELSRRLWRCKVVGFSTVGYQAVTKQRREGESCREPGARDTDEFYPDPNKEYERYFKDGKWDDLSRLPWQSEYSPHAKVAQNGAIIRGIGL
jgi:hypothetical protein